MRTEDRETILYTLPYQEREIPGCTAKGEPIGFDQLTRARSPGPWRAHLKLATNHCIFTLSCHVQLGSDDQTLPLGHTLEGLGLINMKMELTWDKSVIKTSPQSAHSALTHTARETHEASDKFRHLGLASYQPTNFELDSQSFREPQFPIRNTGLPLIQHSKQIAGLMTLALSKFWVRTQSSGSHQASPYIHVSPYSLPPPSWFSAFPSQSLILLYDTYIPVLFLPLPQLGSKFLQFL